MDEIKVLLTTKYWFFGPDGNQYRAIWGVMQDLESAYSFGGNDAVLVPKKQMVAIIDCQEKPSDTSVYCVE